MLTIRFSGLAPAVGHAVRWLNLCDVRASFDGLAIIDTERAAPRAVVALIDLGRGASITNAATEICDATCERYLSGIAGLRLENVRWLYRDSIGRWDEIVPEPRLGVGFLAVGSVDFRQGGDLAWALRTVADHTNGAALSKFAAMLALHEVGETEA